MNRMLLPGLVSLGVSVAAKRVLERRSTHPDKNTPGGDLLAAVIGLLAGSAVGAWLDSRYPPPR